MLGGNLGQPATNRVEISSRQQALRTEHLRMRNRSACVVLDQTIVERVILAGGVPKYPFVERRAFVPKTTHACCSAGLSALIFSTTRVPVPSLVNTSARMPSTDLYEITCTRRTPPRIASSIALAFGNMPSFKLP